MILADSLSISLGMGLSVTLKAGVKLSASGWLWGAVAQWSEHLHAAKVGCPGFDSQWLSWVLISSNLLTNVDGMKDLWCCSTAQLLSTQI